VWSRIRSEFGLLGERVRRRTTQCVVDEVHPGIVLSWSGSSSGWVALVSPTVMRVACCTSGRCQLRGFGPSSGWMFA